MTPSIVEMKGIQKSFLKVHVLKGIDFDLKKGEIHALMGENGAGKSTMMKILTGMYKADEGDILFKGKNTAFSGAKDAEQNGVAVIHQELSLIPHLTVAENMFLGKELTYGKTGWLRTKEMERKTTDFLNTLGITLSPRKRTGDLSIGLQQMIEIARAVAANTEVLIMDEPTAALTDQEIETLFQVMNKLREQGVAIVYISHRMEEVFRMSDRVTVLRDGKSIGTKLTTETNFEEIVSMMVGRELGERFPERTAQIGEERLRVEGLSLEETFKDVSFSVKKGEIVGIAGLMGAGRTEIVETLFGARRKATGNIWIDGEKVTIHRPDQAIKTGMALITEDRKEKGLLLQTSVKENISLTQLKRLATKGWILRRKESEQADKMIQKLSIRTAGSHQQVKYLSGGNQQKVVFAKWLGVQPKVLLLDEPTRGVDVGAKKEIYTIMNELTEQGVSIVMVSSELPEVLGMSDRILVLREGKVTGEFYKEDATQEKIMEAATGGMN